MWPGDRPRVGPVRGVRFAPIQRLLSRHVAHAGGPTARSPHFISVLEHGSIIRSFFFHFSHPLRATAMDSSSELTHLPSLFQISPVRHWLLPSLHTHHAPLQRHRPGHPHDATSSTPVRAALNVSTTTRFCDNDFSGMHNQVHRRRVLQLASRTSWMATTGAATGGESRCCFSYDGESTCCNQHDIVLQLASYFTRTNGCDGRGRGIFCYNRRFLLGSCKHFCCDPKAASHVFVGTGDHFFGDP